jgi:hypothetical protein
VPARKATCFDCSYDGFEAMHHNHP